MGETVKTAEIDTLDDAAGDAMLDDLDAGPDGDAAEGSAQPKQVAKVGDGGTDLAKADDEAAAVDATQRFDDEKDASSGKRKKDSEALKAEADVGDVVPEQEDDAAETPDLESMSLLDRLAAEYEAEAAAKEAASTDVVAGGKKNKNKKRKKGKGGQDASTAHVEVVSAPAPSENDDEDMADAENVDAEMLKHMGLPTGFG